MVKLLIFWSIVSLVTETLCIPTISVNGTKFFIDNADRTQFYIKGVAYQPGDSSKMEDPLANKQRCEADIPLMKDLGVNTLNVYWVDPALSHDACMSAFAEAGIYVLVSVVSPLTGINRSLPTWTLEMYEAYTAVVDVFAKYDNVLGFYMGNEIIQDTKSAVIAPFIKAVIQDLKNYISARRHRRIPVGYNAVDESIIRKSLAVYLACNTTRATIDFVSFNKYSWCGDSTFSESGYDSFLKEMDAHWLPVFFGETGCNTRARTFSDQDAILGPQMNGRLSGAIIYEWSQEINKYGLVSYPPTASSPTAIPMVPDFKNLKSRWATLNPDGTQTKWISPLDAREPLACPSSSSAWPVNPSASLPTLGVRTFADRAIVTPSSKTLTDLTGLTGLPKLTKTRETGIPATGAASNNNSNTNNTTTDKTNPANSLPPKKTSGTAVGIGTGVGIAALALLALLAWFLLRRRKQKRSNKAILDPLEPAGLEVSGVDTFQSKPELDSSSLGTAGLHSGERRDHTVVELGVDEKHEIKPPVVREIASAVIIPSEAEARHLQADSPVQGEEHGGSTMASNSNSANTPWVDEGREEFSQKQMPSALVQAHAQSSDRFEIERLEEEERRLDREIVESERLRNLQIERARVRSLLEEKRRAGGGGGG